MHTNLPEILCCDVVEMIQTSNNIYFGYEILGNAYCLRFGYSATTLLIQLYYRNFTGPVGGGKYGGFLKTFHRYCSSIIWNKTCYCEVFMTVLKIWNPPHLKIPRILKYGFCQKLFHYVHLSVDHFQSSKLQWGNIQYMQHVIFWRKKEACCNVLYVPPF